MLPGIYLIKIFFFFKSLEYVKDFPNGFSLLTK